MIVPMKKFYLIVLDKDRTSVPERLRSLGIAHIEELQGSGETYQALEREKAEVETVFYLLSNYRNKKSKSVNSTIKEKGPRSNDERQKIIKEILTLKNELDSMRDRLTFLSREIDRAASWGEISASLLLNVCEKIGYSIYFFETTPKEGAEILQNQEYIKLKSPKGKLRIALLVKEGEKLPELPSFFQEFVPPEMPVSAMRQEAGSILQRKAEIESRLRTYASYLPTLQSFLDELEANLTMERLRSGMPGQAQFAYLQGYVPAREANALAKMAARYSWAVAFDDPSGEDKPPTLVENPPAIRIIKPVFDFLGTLPNYYEYEISFWFLIFFLIFSAMIFGDGGYGMIITLGSLASILKARRRGKQANDAQKLFTVLGVVTLLWGAATGSWFGIAFDHLPSVLQHISIPWINGQSPDSESNIKAICFLIGLIQLSIAHIKNVKRDFPNLKFLSQIGSLLLLAGMFNVALNLVVDAKRFPIGSWAVLCIEIGFALVFVFGNWTGALGSSLLESLKGIISIFLGTVSVFADIVSYIRLWAVGLAGLAISQTVNGMAASILGGGFTGFVVGFIIKALLAVVLLVASHSLNFVMTILSILVHGIRLNMLEFSGHLGMEWSGYKYNPLKEKEVPSVSIQ